MEAKRHEETGLSLLIRTSYPPIRVSSCVSPIKDHVNKGRRSRDQRSSRIHQETAEKMHFMCVFVCVGFICFTRGGGGVASLGGVENWAEWKVEGEEWDE